MWNALPITRDLYGFQLEHSYSKPWTATVTVNESIDGLELAADVFLFDLKGSDAYEQLLESIRRFSVNLKRDKGKHTCLLTFRCKGIADEVQGLTLPAESLENGYLLVDLEFSEEL